MARSGKARVRQNPTVATEKQSGENCPVHGVYIPSREVLAMRRQAQDAGMEPAAARSLLEQAERLNRTCPACGGVRPSDREWAVSVRERLADQDA